MDSEYISSYDGFKITMMIAQGTMKVSEGTMMVADRLTFFDFGLVLNYEIGQYYIKDKKKWLLAKIKYGI